ncbi:carboxypeptidase regulatory-like domain-containing protein [bacterium]|nr:carboxypeptidase regulatory-like domain-containing protein [bacterium]
MFWRIACLLLFVGLAGLAGAVPESTLMIDLTDPTPKNTEGLSTATIVGVVHDAESGEPIPGARVGLGDFGQFPSADLEALQARRYVGDQETDEGGQFSFTWIPFAEHSLFVTHPGYVRQEVTVFPTMDSPRAELQIALKKGARIDVSVVYQDGQPAQGDLMIRLEGLDGQTMLPADRQQHFFFLATEVWPAIATEGIYSYEGLPAGRYLAEAIEVGHNYARYHGRSEKVHVNLGEERTLTVRAMDNDTSVTAHIERDTYSQYQVPRFVLIARDPGLLVWDMETLYPPNDPRVGRLMLKSLITAQVDLGESYHFANFPSGTYAVFWGPSFRPNGGKLRLAPGDDKTIELGWEPPQGSAKVDPTRLVRKVSLDARTYTAEELAQLMTETTDDRPVIAVDPAIALEKVEMSAGPMTVFDVIESLCFKKNWRIREQGRNTLIILPAE